MSIKKIKKYNPQKFLDDLNRVRDVLVILPKSNVYLRVTKKELKKEAETSTINYYITNEIFKVVRDAMVVE